MAIRRGPIDLEAKFEPNLLNTAIYLLGLSQQVSTFAINFQVRGLSLYGGEKGQGLTYLCLSRDDPSVRVSVKTRRSGGVSSVQVLLHSREPQISCPR